MFPSHSYNIQHPIFPRSKQQIFLPRQVATDRGRKTRFRGTSYPVRVHHRPMLKVLPYRPDIHCSTCLEYPDHLQSTTSNPATFNHILHPHPTYLSWIWGKHTPPQQGTESSASTPCIAQALNSVSRTDTTRLAHGQTPPLAPPGPTTLPHPQQHDGRNNVVTVRHPPSP